jgi:C1A family cysteine protease
VHTRRYGWNRDHHDHRDLLYAAHRPKEFALEAPLPKSVDLRPTMPSVWDQGTIGSCVGHGTAAALAHLRITNHMDLWTPSRLFLYYGVRFLENSVAEDAGGQIRDAIKWVAATGCPPEDLWPYDTAKFASVPPPPAFEAAALHKALTYLRVDWTKLDEIKACLAAGFPIVFGFMVYSDFESEQCAKTGILHMPSARERCQGGHCTCMVGFDDDKAYDGGVGMGLVRNSWGDRWGDPTHPGHFWIPYPYLTSPALSDDFWSIRSTM